MNESLSPDDHARQWLQQVYRGELLQQGQCRQLVDFILKQKINPTIAAAILALISQRGEDAAEVGGALQAAHQAMLTLELHGCLAQGSRYYDVVGTGGDSKQTVSNIHNFFVIYTLI